ncbi:MAG: undecaprenyl-diphosphate phosphatase [Defluviitaleaceae bacterium]|nr:undecaprenyl-diphosphate phosphatase [Defluviitaleaceae bacterium]
MTIFQAIILGIVQGIAEFLPISSSGHLVLLHGIFGCFNVDMDISESYLFTFDIVVHLGTLVAIFVAFWPEIWKLVKNPFSRMTGLLIVGSLPIAILGFVLRDSIIANLRTGIWLAVAFTVTGVLLIVADKFTQNTKDDKDITYLDALVVGLMQALALPPGISRSGMTITGGLTRGLNRETATRFSFMLALIAIAGASLLEGIDVVTGGTAIATLGAVPIIIGLIVSAVVGYAAIRLLLRLIKACKLRYFSYYLWALAAFLVIDFLFITPRIF